MHERILLSIFVITFPLVVFVSTLPPQRFRNEITEWGERDSNVYKDFVNYREQFGVNEFVVVSWPDCDLDDPRVEAVTSGVETELAGLVEQVSNGQRAYWELRDRWRLSEASALRRLRNTFVAKDSEATAVGFSLSESGRLDRNHVVSRVEKILESSGVDPESATFAGLGHNLYSLDREGLESPFRMVPLIMLLAFLLTIVFVRNFGLALFINALGAYTGCLAFNIVYLADVDMNAIIWPLPTLTMLLTVSASLHFLSYFRNAAESNAERFRTEDATNLDGEVDQTETETSSASKLARLKNLRSVARQARGAAIKPVLCCTATTTIGLLSLLLSSSEPVRQFGLFGAVSIAIANGLVLIWLPAFLTLVGQAKELAMKTSRQPIGVNVRDGWYRLARFTQSFRWGIIGGCLTILVWCAIGIPKIETGTSLENYFPAGHQVLEEATAVEAATGPLNSVELLLAFSNHDPENDPLRIRGLTALGSEIVKNTAIESCISAATFAPKLKRRPTGTQAVVESTRLDRLKEAMVEMGLLAMDPDEKTESWRISCRYSSQQSLDIPDVSKQLKSLANQLFHNDGELILNGEGLELTTTGEFVLFDHVDRHFFRELMVTYSTAFCAITLVIVIVLWSPRTCLVAILPNLFPAVVVMGVAGHLGYSLDVASLMTASVALGIAVDDTLHFLLWQREVGGVLKDSSHVSSIETTMRYCGSAILQTSAILGSSIVLYAFCGFLPTVRFGILLSAMMFAALVGDLLLLPALLRPSNRLFGCAKNGDRH